MAFLISYSHVLDFGYLDILPRLEVCYPTLLLISSVPVDFN
jgi:hypothetical protein